MHTIPSTNGLTSGEIHNLSNCFEIDGMNLIGLGVTADDGRDYTLNYSQFLYSEFSANPDLEDNPATPPQRLEIHFTLGTVLITGSALEALARAVQRGELKSVWRYTRKSLDPDARVHVNSVTVTIHQKQIDDAPASNRAGR
jgi:hypothetical protein